MRDQDDPTTPLAAARELTKESKALIKALNQNDIWGLHGEDFADYFARIEAAAVARHLATADRMGFKTKRTRNQTGTGVKPPGVEYPYTAAAQPAAPSRSVEGLVAALEWIADPLRDVGVHAGGCRCAVHTARAALAAPPAPDRECAEGPGGHVWDPPVCHWCGVTMDKVPPTPAAAVSGEARLVEALEDIEGRGCQAAVWHDIPDRWLVCMDPEYQDDEPTQPCPPCTARAALAAARDTGARGEVERG